jgi:hypothetical protein
LCDDPPGSSIRTVALRRPVIARRGAAWPGEDAGIDSIARSAARSAAVSLPVVASHRAAGHAERAPHDQASRDRRGKRVAEPADSDRADAGAGWCRRGLTIR